MSVSYYIYYRVSPDRHVEAQNEVAEIFADLREAQGVVGRLACRRDDPDTWMEIYEGVGDVEAFSNALDQATRKFSINGCLMPGTTRMTEIFVPMNADSAPPAGTSRDE